MRFYLKLSLFVVAFLAIYRVSETYHEPIREAAFMLRCGFAWASGNERMIDQLITEGQHELRQEYHAIDENSTTCRRPPAVAGAPPQPAEYAQR